MCPHGSWQSERIPLGTSVCSGAVMDVDAVNAYAYADVNGNDAVGADAGDDVDAVVHKPLVVAFAQSVALGVFDADAAVADAVGNCSSCCRLLCWECTVTWAS